MSDLLTRLAQRALGVAPSVEPLLRPRYAADLPGASAPDPEPDAAAAWPSPAAAPAARDAHPAAGPASPPASAAFPAPAAGDAVRRDASPPAPAPEIRAAAPPLPVETADDGLLLPPASPGADPPTLPLEPRAASAASAGQLSGDGAPDPADASHPHAPARSSRPARGASASSLRERSSASTSPPADATGTHPGRRDPVIRPPRPFVDERGRDEDDDLLLPPLPLPERVFAEMGREGDAERRSAGRTGALPSPLPAFAAEADGEARAEGEDADEPVLSAPDRDPRSFRPPARPVRLAGAGEAAAEGPARAAGGDEARPVVRVSIGRVEVRGAPPAEPAPARTRPAWTPPVLSLADYLERGAGR